MSEIDTLKEILGDIVYTDSETCLKASFDGMKLSFMPEAVIKITEEEQVGTVLKLANESNIPITTRGAGSSLTGSAAPIKGGWVIDLMGLNSIKIDAFNKFAYVGAGVTTETVQQAALEHGLFYPPDPSSRKFCSIGGNIACNAGGLRGVKYGVTRDYVVALRGFLPTGEEASWGLPLKKFASGYNVRDLWIGSEGTLGIVTHAVLKLIPRPQATWTCLASFEKESHALQAAHGILSEGLVPSALEFLDTLTVTGAQQTTGKSLLTSESAQCALIIEVDGHESEVTEQKAKVLSIIKTSSVMQLQASSEKEALPFWLFRRECSSAMFQHGNSKLNEDIVVPIEKLGELTAFVQKLMDQTGLKIPSFGHAGDGNLHINIMYDREDPKQCKQAEIAIQALMEKVVELNGAITGEHGIGLAKSPFLRLQHTEAELQAMLAIKRALDPKGLLNPGKIFEPFEVWKHKPIEAKLPWDHA